jgi:tetratricopeptide (TPR) repeat protein
LQVPTGARGFYFFYKGLEAFDAGGAVSGGIGGERAIARAKSEFERVPTGTPYYARAQYYLGVIYTVMKEPDAALGAFSRVIRTTSSESLKELATINIARVYYERKDYRKAFSFYSQIQRDSDLWLQTLFEGAWAFFMIQKHNNTLGNIHTIHSPFFSNRFYPETYILNAVTYLRLCRFQALRDQLRKFQERYKPTFADLNNLLKKYQNNPEAYFSLISKYRSTGKMGEYNAATEVVDSVSRSDAFKEAASVARGLEREAAQLRAQGARWEMSGLADVLRTSYEARRKATVRTSGEILFTQTVQQFRYLRDLSDQTRLINLEMLSGRTDQLRQRYNPEQSSSDQTQWGEGMKPLNLKQEIEYWPFEGEYWEDELGGYVYNIDSKCGQAPSSKK